MTKARDDLTRDLILELFRYDANTGRLFWRKSRGGVIAGSEAGYDKPDSRTVYRRVRINGSLYYTHRLIWLIETGEWPDGQIDHQDQDGLNNRISNLRSVTHQENQRNARMNSNNTSGVTGVSWCRLKEKWQAYICADNEQKHLGFFDNIENAKAARLEAEKEYGFTERHGT
jgi:uncharacterized protein YeaC (DUF1315 family)